MEHDDVEETGEDFYFQFYSNSPKGKIKKVIKYQQIWSLHSHVFNISFGDWNENGGYLDDEVVSNNNDRNKVLATVALSMTIFNKENIDSNILIAGSTCSRTRLYQMAIAKFQYQFADLYEIKGYIMVSGFPFKKVLIMRHFC